LTTKKRNLAFRPADVIPPPKLENDLHKQHVKKRTTDPIILQHQIDSNENMILRLHMIDMWCKENVCNTLYSSNATNLFLPIFYWKFVCPMKQFNVKFGVCDLLILPPKQKKQIFFHHFWRYQHIILISDSIDSATLQNLTFSTAQPKTVLREPDGRFEN